MTLTDDDRAQIRARAEAVSPDGARLIEAERRRQIEVEGYTPSHDREHGGFALAQAALCYEVYGLLPAGAIPTQWPWRLEDWKPRDPISNLIRAGALYLAATEQGYSGAKEGADRCADLIDRTVAHIAGMDPVTTLALLDERDQLAAEVDQYAVAYPVTLARAEAAEAKLAAVEALLARGVDDCECGHGLDEHNGLGCYAKLSYNPLVTCLCNLADDRTHADLVEANIRAAIEGASR